MSEPTSNPNIWAVILTIVTTLGGSKVWELLQKRLELGREERESVMKGQIAYRDEMMKRIASLEQALTDSVNERVDLLNRITSLSQEVARLEVKVEYLQRENDQLKNVVTKINAGADTDEQ